MATKTTNIKQRLRRRLSGHDIDAMTPTQRERFFRQTDREFAGKTEAQLRSMTRPLTAAERKTWNQAKKMGRPRVGAGAKMIALSIERGLLDRADAHARHLGVTRAALIARALAREIAAS